MADAQSNQISSTANEFSSETTTRRLADLLNSGDVDAVLALVLSI